MSSSGQGGLDAEQEGAESEELQEEGGTEKMCLSSTAGAEMPAQSRSKSSSRNAKMSRGVSFGVKIAESVIDESAAATAPERCNVKEEAHMPPSTPLRGALKVVASVGSEQFGWEGSKSNDRFRRHGGGSGQIGHSPIPSPLRGVGNSSPPLRAATTGNSSLVTSTSPFAFAFSSRAQSVAERWLSRKEGVESCMGALGTGPRTLQRKLIPQHRQLRRHSMPEPQVASYPSGAWREVTCPFSTCLFFFVFHLEPAIVHEGLIKTGQMCAGG